VRVPNSLAKSCTLVNQNLTLFGQMPGFQRKYQQTTFRDFRKLDTHSLQSTKLSIRDSLAPVSLARTLPPAVRSKHSCDTVRHYCEVPPNDDFEVSC